MDLKTAFDLVDKRVLIGTMKNKGVRERLIKRMEEVVREIKSRVTSGREIRRILDRKGGGETRISIESATF